MPHSRSALPTSLFLLVATLLSTTACSGSSEPEAGAGEPSASSFSITGVDVQSPTPPAPALPDSVRAGALTTLNRYLDAGMLAPLRSGTAGDLSSAFTSAATARLGGPDRVALLDEGLPRSGNARAKTAAASLSALAGTSGDFPIVAAEVQIQVVSGSGSDALTIERTGDLILVDDGGAWKIDGYDIRVARDSGGVTTTTGARR